MVHGVESALDIGQNVGVRGHVGAREVLGPNGQVLAHDRGLEDLAEALEACDGDGDVALVCEPVWVYKGLVLHARGGDGDVAAGEGRDGGGHYGGVLVAVDGRADGRGFEVADVTREGEIFYFGPVGGEGGEIWRGVSIADEAFEQWCVG